MMRFIITLVIKNLFRYRRRTIITALAIAAGIAMYIFLDAWLLGAQMESIRNLVEFETGSARILNNRYWEEHDFLLPKYNIAEPAGVENALESAGYLIAPRVTVYADASKVGGEGESFTFQLVGIEPGKDERIFKLMDSITPAEGKYLVAGEPEILVGSDIASRFSISVGSSLQLSTKTRNGAWTGMEVRVTGILSTPDPIVNNAMGFVPLDVLQEVLQLGNGVTDIVIGFPEWLDPEKETATIAALLASLPGTGDYTVKNYNELAAEFSMISQSKSAGSKILLFLIFIIAAIGVSNTMLMAIFERVREIGMMRALGMKDGSILVSFIIEAMGIGLLGAMIGVILGILGNIFMVNVGVDLSYFLKGMGNIGYRSIGIFKSAWNFDTIVTAAVFSVLFSGIMAVLPARRALRKEITDCLRIK